MRARRLTAGRIAAHTNSLYLEERAPAAVNVKLSAVNGLLASVSEHAKYWGKLRPAQ